jgi:hypothetical protein
MGNTGDYLQQNEPGQTRSGFSLSDLAGFPYSEYARKLTELTEFGRWFSGDILEETHQNQSGKAIELYPVKINPIRGAVAKHASALFGEVPQDDRPLVYPRVTRMKEVNKEAANLIEEVLYKIWIESAGRSLQMDNAIISQIYGGCIFRLAWDPFNQMLTHKVKIEKVHPKSFFGIPDVSNPYFLDEMWIVRLISPYQAGRFGVNIDVDDAAYYVERWTKESYQVTVNGEVVKTTIEGNGITADKIYSDANPFGFIPAVYIPHTRSGGFYGESIIEPVKGLIREYNSRFADVGDSISVDTHRLYGMRNVNGAVNVKKIAPTLTAIDLGSSLDFKAIQLVRNQHRNS